MNHTRDAILPVLTLLASSGGSGFVAYHLIDALKRRIAPTAGAAGQLLHAPRYVRVVALLLAAVIAVLAKIGIAALVGEDLRAAADLALAAAISAVVSQLLHGLTLSPLTPAQREAQEQARILQILNESNVGYAALDSAWEARE